MIDTKDLETTLPQRSMEWLLSSNVAFHDERRYTVIVSTCVADGRTRRGRRSCADYASFDMLEIQYWWTGQSSSGDTLVVPEYYILYDQYIAH